MGFPQALQGESGYFSNLRNMGLSFVGDPPKWVFSFWFPFKATEKGGGLQQNTPLFGFVGSRLRSFRNFGSHSSMRAERATQAPELRVVSFRQNAARALKRLVRLFWRL